LIAEVIDELGIRGSTIGIAPVGCAVLEYDYIDVDMIEVAHGRAPAVATGMKRTNPDKIIFSYEYRGRRDSARRTSRGTNNCHIH
jgi:2-oxoglutarate ferredoxin oxidoreductase subunit beta